MAKYILFQNSKYYRLAPNETKKDYWMTTPTVHAKEVSDDDYTKVARFLKFPTYNTDTQEISYEDKVVEAITDPAIAKNALSSRVDELIMAFRDKAQEHINTDLEVQGMITFLEGVDRDAVDSFPENHSVDDYIYNLPGCPQMYFNEMYY
tara:strand:- start:661 stop:1110 length:450 start_codon:yes stop_codon:yes gene_type:complete